MLEVGIYRCQTQMQTSAEPVASFSLGEAEIEGTTATKRNRDVSKARRRIEVRVASAVGGEQPKAGASEERRRNLCLPRAQLSAPSLLRQTLPRGRARQGGAAAALAARRSGGAVAAALLLDLLLLEQALGEAVGLVGRDAELAAELGGGGAG